jgi:glycosyltransferase involved in cell wall biosynthesis
MVRIAVVIPAYNEEASIANVVKDIRAQSSAEVELTPVVVNDCSKDKTAEIINAAPCIALHLPVNLGIGGAVQTGFMYAYQNHFDYAIQVDGDGQHPANQIVNLYKHLIKHRLDVVIGSRFIDKQGFQSSFARRIGIRYFKWLNLFLTGKRITDNTSGFRLLNRKALEITNRYYPDEYPEPEAVILFHKKGLLIGEYPVEMLERQGGVSSIGTWKSVYYMFKVTIAILFSYIRKK